MIHTYDTNDHKVQVVYVYIYICVCISYMYFNYVYAYIYTYKYTYTYICREGVNENGNLHIARDLFEWFQLYLHLKYVHF